MAETKQEVKHTPGKLRQGLTNALAIVGEDGKPVLVLCPTFDNSADGESVRRYASIINSHELLVEALEAIAIALKDPTGGEYWTARKFLDKQNVWHGDIDGEKVLLEVAKAALQAAKQGR